MEIPYCRTRWNGAYCFYDILISKTVKCQYMRAPFLAYFGLFWDVFELSLLHIVRSGLGPGIIFTVDMV
jgi:hypothetical protein